LAKEPKYNPFLETLGPGLMISVESLCPLKALLPLERISANVGKKLDLPGIFFLRPINSGSWEKPQVFPGNLPKVCPPGDHLMFPKGGIKSQNFLET